MIHKLKTWPEFFEAMVEGRKTFEGRKNDRDFKVGDELILKEYDPELKNYGYSGRFLHRRVSYILEGTQFGVMPGYVIMGLEKV